MKNCQEFWSTKKQSTGIVNYAFKDVDYILYIHCAQQVKDQIKPFLRDFLNDDGPKNCIPKCPMDVIPWFHGHAVYQYYIPGSKDCSVKATQGLPFFTENYGPNWTEYTTTVHEFAGHHVEV